MQAPLIFTTADVLAIAGTIIASLLTCVGLLLGHIFKGINRKLTDLGTADHDFHKMLEGLENKFVPRREFEASERVMSRSLDELKETVARGFERMYDKMEERT